MNVVTCDKLYAGKLSQGCKQCITGHKSVIFITGRCHYQCFYCPISDDKRGKDIVKINEHVITQPDSLDALNQLFLEIENCQSTGASITGGDPLAVMNRTCRYIRALKKRFGPSFHLHLYTSPYFVTQEALLLLNEAGLDEIRFHLDVTDISQWEKIYFAQGLQFEVGVEIPAIPGMVEKTKELISFCKESKLVSFINLNELEYSDISENILTQKGYVVKDVLSYGIKNSEEVAKELVEFGRKKGMSVHYCSAEFKDKVQLGNRLRLRSQTVKKDYDLVDEEGLLIRGEITLLSQDTTNKKLDLTTIKLELEEDFQIPEELIVMDDNRILIASWVIEEIYSQIKEKSDEYPWIEDVECAIVKEYPTDDHFLIERTVL